MTAELLPPLAFICARYSLSRVPNPLDDSDETEEINAIEIEPNEIIQKIIRETKAMPAVSFQQRFRFFFFFLTGHWTVRTSRKFIYLLFALDKDRMHLKQFYSHTIGSARLLILKLSCYARISSLSILRRTWKMERASARIVKCVHFCKWIISLPPFPSCFSFAVLRMPNTYSEQHIDHK